MPSPTSSSTSPARPDATQDFLARERASLEAINAITSPTRASAASSRSSSGEAISQEVAAMAIRSAADELDDNGDTVMHPAGPAAADVTAGPDSAKIEYGRPAAAVFILPIGSGGRGVRPRLPPARPSPT